MMIKRTVFRPARVDILTVLWFAAVGMAAAQVSSFTQGEKLFLENKPREASVLLDRATKENPQDEKAWLYLGICYRQLGSDEGAIAAFRN